MPLTSRLSAQMNRLEDRELAMLVKLGDSLSQRNFNKGEGRVTI